MYILRTEMQGGAKLMVMPFEIVYVYGFGTFFQKRVVLQLIHIYINSTCYHFTDECLEQFFVCFPTLLRMLMN